MIALKSVLFHDKKPYNVHDIAPFENHILVDALFKC